MFELLNRLDSISRHKKSVVDSAGYFYESCTEIFRSSKTMEDFYISIRALPELFGNFFEVLDKSFLLVLFLSESCAFECTCLPLRIDLLNI